jgi:low affinity Fe/Cu permease
MKRTLKLFGIVYFAFAGMLLFGANAMAYIDPSVMTYLIQAIAGVVIAVGAVVGIYWRKAKKKVNEKLGIDENKNKEVESDDIIVEDKAEAESEKTEEK